MTTYLIINISELPLVDFNDIKELSPNTLRYSLDGTKTIIKWDGDAPDFVPLLSTSEGPYTHSEILDILSGTYWTEPEV